MNKTTTFSIFFLLFSILLYSCGDLKEKTKQSINKSGETVGKSASEFFEGVSEGVEKTIQCELSLSAKLKEKGLKKGKFIIKGYGKNTLSLYLIFDKDFKEELTLKVMDEEGLEMGRLKQEVEAKAGDAGFYEFVFAKDTYIEVKGQITVE